MLTLDVLTWHSVADGRDRFSVKQTQFKQTDFFCATTKRPAILENMNIFDTKVGHLGSAEVTHIHRGRFHPRRRKGPPHLQRDLQRHPYDCTWPLPLVEDYPSRESGPISIRHGSIKPWPGRAFPKCVLYSEEVLLA